MFSPNKVARMYEKISIDCLIVHESHTLLHLRHGYGAKLGYE